MTISTSCSSCSKNSVNITQWQHDPNVRQTTQGAPYVWPQYKLALCNSLKPRQLLQNRTSAAQSGCAVTHMCPVVFFLAGEAAPGILGTSYLNNSAVLALKTVK